MGTVWVYQLHWRQTFWEDMTDREEGVLGEHDRYVDSLYTQGHVVLAGAILDPPTGLIFIQATDEDNARTIMASAGAQMRSISQPPTSRPTMMDTPTRAAALTMA